MAAVCHACGAPLNSARDDLSRNYCSGCCDAQGALRPRAEIQRGIAAWFQTWQPNLDERTALKRADLYMRAMPAWADRD